MMCLGDRNMLASTARLGVESLSQSARTVTW